MNLEQCRKKINALEKKYFNNQKNTTKYYQELCDVLYDYAEETGNYDPINCFNDIVSSEDMEGLMNYPTPNSLYYWKSYTEVYEVDYKMLTELSNEALTHLTKDKEQSLDIC